MRMHNPPHPGEIIREFCVEPLNLTVTEAAKALGVTRKTLSTLLNGRAGVSFVRDKFLRARDEAHNNATSEGLEALPTSLI